MTTEAGEGHDEAHILHLVTDEAHAICAKDVDRIMAHYADDVVVFNVKPPLQIRGAAAFRQIWETSLAHFPASFGTETRDLSVVVSGDLAIAHWFLRFTRMGDDDSTQPWLRYTAAYQRKQGRWQAVHSHCSIPFDPDTSKAVFNLEP